jgi:hypothetical protein
MTTPARRPIRTDFTIVVSGSTRQVLPPPWAAVAVPGSVAPPTPAAAASAGRSTSAATRLLDTLWYSNGGGQGGRPLDEALTSLGESYVENGQVVWEFSEDEDLDPTYKDYLSESVAQLNRLIKQGVMVIDDQGQLKPKIDGGPTSTGNSTAM